jgi:ABC-type nitrate/sulfonate/bicarbonate transport system permease component
MEEVNRFIGRSVQIAFLLVVIGLWFAATQTGAVSPLLLPPIDKVWTALRNLVVTGPFWSAVWVTLATVARAYALAVVSGLLIGYVVARSRFLTEVFEPVIANAFTIPIILFFPLFLLFFGIGPGSKIAYGAIYGFFPVALNTIAGLSGVERRYLWAARSMGLSTFGLFRHVLFPSAFPVILTGLRIAFFICFASVLGGEELSASAGIGKSIAQLAELMDAARMYAWIVFVIVVSLALNFALTQVEGRIREH